MPVRSRHQLFAVVPDSPPFPNAALWPDKAQAP
jgi:hypothetical protein